MHLRRHNWIASVALILSVHPSPLRITGNPECPKAPITASAQAPKLYRTPAIDHSVHRTWPNLSVMWMRQQEHERLQRASCDEDIMQWFNKQLILPVQAPKLAHPIIQMQELHRFHVIPVCRFSPQMLRPVSEQMCIASCIVLYYGPQSLSWLWILPSKAG